MKKNTLPGYSKVSMCQWHCATVVTPSRKAIGVKSGYVRR